MAIVANDLIIDGNTYNYHGWKIESEISVSEPCSCCSMTETTIEWNAYNHELLKKEHDKVAYSFYGLKTLEEVINAIQLFEASRGIIYERVS